MSYPSFPTIDVSIEYAAYLDLQHLQHLRNIIHRLQIQNSPFQPLNHLTIQNTPHQQPPLLPNPLLRHQTPHRLRSRSLANHRLPILKRDRHPCIPRALVVEVRIPGTTDFIHQVPDSITVEIRVAELINEDAAVEELDGRNIRRTHLRSRDRDGPTDALTTMRMKGFRLFNMDVTDRTYVRKPRVMFFLKVGNAFNGGMRSTHGIVGFDPNPIDTLPILPKPVHKLVAQILGLEARTLSERGKVATIRSLENLIDACISPLGDESGEKAIPSREPVLHAFLHALILRRH